MKETRNKETIAKRNTRDNSKEKVIPDKRRCHIKDRNQEINIRTKLVVIWSRLEDNIKTEDVERQRDTGS